MTIPERKVGESRVPEVWMYFLTFKPGNEGWLSATGKKKLTVDLFLCEVGVPMSPI